MRSRLRCRDTSDCSFAQALQYRLAANRWHGATVGAHAIALGSAGIDADAALCLGDSGWTGQYRRRLPSSVSQAKAVTG